MTPRLKVISVILFCTVIFAGLLFVFVNWMLESSLRPKLLLSVPGKIISSDYSKFEIDRHVTQDFGLGFSTGGYYGKDEARRQINGKKYVVVVRIDDQLTTYTLPPDTARSGVKYDFRYQRPDGRFETAWRLTHSEGFMQDVLVKKESGVTSIPEELFIYKLP